jgi:hypothetical protein
MDSAMNQMIERQRQLIGQLQEQMVQRSTLAIFPEGVPEPESIALALWRAIAGLNDLLKMPVMREDISGQLITIGTECEHVFDKRTYELLAEVVNTGLESPDQAQYQLKLIARILGIDGHQAELG